MYDDVKFYVSVFLRRIHYFAIVALLFAAAGIATAIVLPTKYRADALLLVESPQIPEQLASSTVRTNAREQLQIIEQRLLTRDNLIDIAYELDVFEDGSTMFPDQIVQRMRSGTTFNISTGRDRASLVRIAFEAERAQTSAAVVNAYVTRVLQSNVELRQDRAEGTVEFFDQELSRLSLDLETKSAEILEFKNANIDSLPENLRYQLDRLSNLRDRANQIDREIVTLDQQRERLILVFNTTNGASAAQSAMSPEQRELVKAEGDLNYLLTIYTEQNPRVKAQMARVQALRNAAGLGGTSADGEGAEATDPAEAILNIQLSEIDSRKEQLEGEYDKIGEEIEVLQDSVDDIPGNSIRLEALMRDYQNTQDQYNRTVQSASAAATGERIEQLSKGERISVISQPTVPRKPSSPNRPLIAGMGVAAGIGAGFALVVLLELLNRSIRRPADLTRALGITPLATLPMMRTPREIAMRRGLVVSVILFGTLGVVAAVFYTHTQLMPLDLLAARAINVIGL